MEITNIKPYIPKKANLLLLYNALKSNFWYRCWTNSGLKRLKVKLTIKPPASMHNPTKMIHATICRALNTKLSLFVMVFNIKLRHKYNKYLLKNNIYTSLFKKYLSRNKTNQTGFFSMNWMSWFNIIRLIQKLSGRTYSFCCVVHTMTTNRVIQGDLTTSIFNSPSRSHGTVLETLASYCSMFNHKYK